MKKPRRLSPKFREKNERRIQLIEMSFDGAITPVERAELSEVEGWVGAELNRVFPLPWAKLRALERLAGLLVALVVLVVVLCGCSTDREFRSFVQATRHHYQEVSPVYRKAVQGDVEIHRAVRRTKILDDRTFDDVIFRAEVRLGLREDPDGD